MAQELGIGPRVTFEGRRPSLELPAWYQAADVFVLPSFAEGLSLALLEAMACACPIITTRPAQGEHDAVQDGENGLLVKWGRPGEISQAIQRMANSPELAAQLGQAGHQTVKASFTWPVIAADTAAVYRAALNSRVGEG
jgi:glycosyltransferase involved in cell wall biosynthesis